MNFPNLFKSNLPDKLFFEGQEITPLHKHQWHYLDNVLVTAQGPKFGEIVKCKEYVKAKNNIWYIRISGYEGAFDETDFAPVISDDQLEEMLNEVDELMIREHGA